jgi:hypothetical protein
MVSSKLSFRAMVCVTAELHSSDQNARERERERRREHKRQTGASIRRARKLNYAAESVNFASAGGREHHDAQAPDAS